MVERRYLRSEMLLESLLSRISNVEPKQVLMMVMEWYPQRRGELAERLYKLLKTPWKPSCSVIDGYIESSLLPGGFVFRGVYKRNKYYALSERGEIFGQPVAAYSLKTANDIDESLFCILGSANSSGDSRAPYNRFRTLEMLLEGDKTKAEIERELDLHSSLVYTLLALKDAGLIEYEQHRKSSYVKLTPKGKVFADEFTRKLRDAVKGGNELKEMKRLFERFKEDSELFSDYATKGVELYASVSPRINRKSKDYWKEQIIKYLKEEGEARPTDVAERIFGSRRSLFNAMKYITMLYQEEGILRKSGHASYRIKSS
ncbi:MAG TPA: ArsR family transcriptional regulator [Candidatus Aenigmarchaeota archaeon]|nr:MAG: hypothetical protein DRP03_01355 [Candidatus Aenigmarchaeota archaeon]HDD45990.1 ArsR family transcriptional regulator [Candidatus Aenigmarchaeota archaeon]